MPSSAYSPVTVESVPVDSTIAKTKYTCTQPGVRGRSCLLYFGADQNVTVSNNYIPGGLLFGITVGPYSGTDVDVMVSGNKISNALYDGVYAEETNGLTIGGNNFTVPPGAVASKIDTGVSGLLIENEYVNGLLETTSTT